MQHGSSAALHSLPVTKRPKRDALIDNGGRGLEEVAYDGEFFGMDQRNRKI
jgi:hypothetical protein